MSEEGWPVIFPNVVFIEDVENYANYQLRASFPELFEELYKFDESCQISSGKPEESLAIVRIADPLSWNTAQVYKGHPYEIHW